jgi:hypothetical protein
VSLGAGFCVEIHSEPFLSESILNRPEVTPPGAVILE